jgi:hypothetical protein
LEKLDINALQNIAAIFPFKSKKGENSFASVEKIFAIKALFPNLSTSSCIELFGYTDAGKYDPLNLTKLSDIESKGFKIESKLKDIGKSLSEYSPFLKSYKNEIFFDISSTNLPRRLSRAYNIRSFNINDNFLKKCIDSYKKNTGLILQEHAGNQISLDYRNKTIYYPTHDNYRKKFSSLLRAITTARIVSNQNTYNEIINNKEKANKLRVNIKLVESALFKSFGLDVSNDCFDGIYKDLNNKDINTADFRKGYVWGGSNEAVLKKINDLSAVIKDITQKGDFEANYLEEYAKQEDEKKENFINSSVKFDYTELNQALADERSRVIDDINNQVSISEVIEDFAGAQIKKSGSSFKTQCISPDHQDNNPSLSISDPKGVCHCLTCGFSANIFQVVQTTNNVSFPQAVDLIADRYNISTNYDFIKSQFKKNEDKNSYLISVLNEFKEYIDNFEYEKLLNMNEKSLKEYRYSKRLEIEKKEEYKLKEQNVSEEPKELNSYVYSSEDIELDKDAIKYLRDVRGFKEIHPDLRLFTGKHTYPDGYAGEYKMVGFINESNGADGKFYVGEKMGIPRSFGNKDLTILNKEGLKNPNPNFIVVESQWDGVAFYNDSECREIMNDCVTIILNGTTNVDKAINYINENKGRYSSLYVLRQGDNANAKAMQRLHFGTAITRVANFNYTDEEVENKKDINDLLKEGIKLSSRINLNMNQNLYQVDSRELV